jgi:succinate dehydrogenase / fumarate reductase iron-sulfur subunit
MNRIKWEHDGSFSYLHSCRYGICGACAIKVNEKGFLRGMKKSGYLDDMMYPNIKTQKQMLWFPC